MADGSETRPLDVTGVGPVAWSPDGGSIAFEYWGDVYVLELDAAPE